MPSQPRNLQPQLIALPYAIARGGLISLPHPKAKNPNAMEILRFQYNPDTVTRARTGQWERKLEKKSTKAPQEKAAADGTRGGALKSKSELISFKLVFDATELRLQDDTDQDGILPELSVLERFALGPDQIPDPPKKGENEFALISLDPTEALLVLGKRTYPGVITQMNIVEQRFDVDLVPIRAEIDLRFRVLETTAIASNPNVEKFFKEMLEQREALAGKAAEAYEGDIKEAIGKALTPRRARGIVDGEVL